MAAAVPARPAPAISTRLTAGAAARLPTTYLQVSSPTIDQAREFWKSIVEIDIIHLLDILLA